MIDKRAIRQSRNTIGHYHIRKLSDNLMKTVENILEMQLKN